MQWAKAPTPGTTSPSASSGCVLVGGHADLGARADQGPLGGAQVARAVVEDDHLHGSSSCDPSSGTRLPARRVDRRVRSSRPTPVKAPASSSR